MDEDKKIPQNPTSVVPGPIKREAENPVGSISESMPEVPVDEEMKEAGVEAISGPEPAPHEIIKGANVELPSDTPVIPVQNPITDVQNPLESAPRSISLEELQKAESILNSNKTIDANTSKARIVKFERGKWRRKTQPLTKAA